MLTVINELDFTHFPFEYIFFFYNEPLIFQTTSKVHNVYDLFGRNI